MKPKKFFDWRMPVGIIGVTVFLLGGIVICLFDIKVIPDIINDGDMTASMFAWTLILSLGFLLGDAFVIWSLSNRTLSWLTVTQKRVVWRCPFHFSVSISIENCAHVGIEDMSKHNRGLLIVRGDEESFIYLSTKPLSPKYKHKIDGAKCKKGFIKFAYSDQLCAALIEILPAEKTNHLQAFYNSIQAKNRMLKRKKRKK